MVGRAAFALHEPAGELAGGGAAFAVVDLEREEIDALAGLGADDGAEDDGSPYWTVTAPSASFAKVPVSIDSMRPPISRSTLMDCI